MSQFLPDGLEKLIQESGLPYKKNSRSFVLDCPKCHKRQKLWILRKSGAFVCWSCKETENYKGWADKALSDLLGMDIQEVRSRIYERAVPPGNQLELNLEDFNNPDLVDVPTQVQLEEMDWPWDSVEIDSKMGQRGLQYLEGRGINLEVCKRYDIRYQPSTRRVLFPVKVDGKLVGWQGRTVEPGVEPKILTSTGLRREYVLMFQDNLKNAPHAVICEGPVDALKADICGGNVATMGKAVSRPQLEIIRNAGIKTVYLALDPDAAEEVNRLTVELGDMETRLLLPPNGKKDLGECSFKEVVQAFNTTKPFVAGNLLLHLNFKART